MPSLHHVNIIMTEEVAVLVSNSLLLWNDQQKQADQVNFCYTLDFGNILRILKTCISDNQGTPCVAVIYLEDWFISTYLLCRLTSHFYTI